MPYIKQEDRFKFDARINELYQLISNDGDANYAITLLMHKLLEKRGVNYQNMNNLIGVLECAKLELYRKVISPYEDKKIIDNGCVSNLDGKKQITSPLDNINILTNRIKNVILKIKKYHTDIIFGGSLALNAIGLLNREIKDIDIFIGYDEVLNIKALKEDNAVNFLYYNEDQDINGYVVKRLGFKMDGVKICVFKVHKSFLEHSKISFENTTLNIQNVNYAILAKRKFATFNSKHFKDLTKIDNELLKF